MKQYWLYTRYEKPWTIFNIFILDVKSDVKNSTFYYFISGKKNTLSLPQCIKKGK